MSEEVQIKKFNSLASAQMSMYMNNLDQKEGFLSSEMNFIYLILPKVNTNTRKLLLNYYNIQHEELKACLIRL